MKITIKPRETFVVTSPVQIPEPPKPRLLTAEENAASAKYVEQTIAARGKGHVPTAEENAAVTRFVEQFKASAKKAT
jgi:hypothetical protein